MARCRKCPIAELGGVRNCGNFGGLRATIAEGGGRTRPTSALLHSFSLTVVHLKIS
jgi:hypothetical protein